MTDICKATVPKSPWAVEHRCTFSANVDGYCLGHHPVRMLARAIRRCGRLEVELEAAKTHVRTLRLRCAEEGLKP